MVERIQELAVKTLIVSVAILTLIAVLAIWDVLDQEALYKSLATIGVIAFSSLIVLVAAKMLERHASHEDQNSAGNQNVQ